MTFRKKKPKGKISETRGFILDTRSTNHTRKVGKLDLIEIKILCSENVIS